MNVAYNRDCLEAMRKYPDNAFDLAVVDPPYGGGAKEDVSEVFNGAISGRFGGRFEKYIKAERTGGTWASKYKTDTTSIKNWDIAPPLEYFDELFRISKNQIIWGGNYFQLPPTRCFLIWRKLTISESFTMAMAEYAWTSFNSNAKVFEYAPQDSTRFHPTQKPVALYAWIYKLYAEKGMKILDTHLGSGSSRIAAYDAGLDFVGYEIDKTYFDKQEERFEKHASQQNLFLMDEQERMNDLFRD